MIELKLLQGLNRMCRCSRVASFDLVSRKGPFFKAILRPNLSRLHPDYVRIAHAWSKQHSVGARRPKSYELRELGA